MKKYLLTLSTSALICASASAATVVVDDSFDDGDIATNTLGIGSGFNAVGSSGGSVTESGGSAQVIAGTPGYKRAYMTSKEGGTISTSTRYEFKGVNFSLINQGATSGGDGRYYFGVKGNSAASDMQGNPETGFWIQVENDNFAATTGVSRLFYESNASARTNLATWTFDTLNFEPGGSGNYTPTVDFTLDLDATSYSLSFTGDTISNLTGSLSGTYASAGISNELTTGYTASFMQGTNPAVAVSFDQIVITQAVPEPSSAALIFGGMSMLLVRRRRR